MTEAPYCGRHPRYLRNGRCNDCDAEVTDIVREAVEDLRTQLAEAVRERDEARNTLRLLRTPLEMLEYMGKRIKDDALQSFAMRSPADPQRPMAERYGAIGNEIEMLAKELQTMTPSALAAVRAGGNPVIAGILQNTSEDERVVRELANVDRAGEGKCTCVAPDMTGPGLDPACPKHGKARELK